MEFFGDFSFLGTTLQVFFIDLLLSGDNAIVIALACRGLPPQQRRRAMLAGIGVAIVLRVYLTTVVSYLLDLPGLKLAGAVALVIIAVKLMVAEEEEGPEGRKQPHDLWAAVVYIVIADISMSLDNVVGLAAVAQGSVLYLALGLLISIPLLMFGSLLVAAVLRRYPVLIGAGGALLGWVAGGIGVTDPLVSAWIDSQAPALPVAMPLLLAVFVVLESRLVERARAKTPPDAPSSPAILTTAAFDGDQATGRMD